MHVLHVGEERGVQARTNEAYNQYRSVAEKSPNGL